MLDIKVNYDVLKGAVMFLAGKHETRYYLKYININRCGALCTTDGHRMFVAEQGYETIGSVKIEDYSYDVNIELLHKLPNDKVINHVHFVETDELHNSNKDTPMCDIFAYDVNNNLVYASKAIMHFNINYPSIMRIINTHHANFNDINKVNEIWMNPEYMIDIMKCHKVVNGKIKYPTVKMKFTQIDNTVEFVLSDRVSIFQMPMRQVENK